MLDDQAGSAQTRWAEAIIGRAFTGLLGDVAKIPGARQFHGYYCVTAGPMGGSPPSPAAGWSACNRAAR